MLADCVTQHGVKVSEVEATSNGGVPARGAKQAARATPRGAFQRYEALAEPHLKKLKFDRAALRALEGQAGFLTRLTRG